MVKIFFLTGDAAHESRHEVQANPGESLMVAAVRNSVPGIVAECGGSCTCATCHVQVDPAWFKKVGPPPDFENEMLIVANDRTETSRLACQVDVTSDLDGLVVRVPAEQGW